MQEPNIQELALGNDQPLSKEAQAFEDMSWQEIDTDTTHLHKDVKMVLDLITSKIKAIRSKKHWSSKDLDSLKKARSLFLSYDRSIREGKVTEQRLKDIVHSLGTIAVTI